jgi:hypothetical protein
LRSAESGRLGLGADEDGPVQLGLTPLCRLRGDQSREAPVQQFGRPGRGAEQESDVPALSAGDQPEGQILRWCVEARLLDQFPGGMGTERGHVERLAVRRRFHRTSGQLQSARGGRRGRHTAHQETSVVRRLHQGDEHRGHRGRPRHPAQAAVPAVRWWRARVSGRRPCTGLRKEAGSLVLSWARAT